MNARRAPAREARRRSKPTAYSAEKPNEVWTWDITYLRSSKYTGRFYYAYVIVDVYSRMVVSARVFEADNADFAARFLGMPSGGTESSLDSLSCTQTMVRA